MLGEKNLNINIYKQMLDNSLNAIGLCDKQGKIYYVNKTFVEMFGYDNKEEILNKTPFDLHPENEIKRLNVTFKKILNNITDNIFKETLYAKKKNGDIFYVEMTANTLKDENGKFYAVMGCFEEITQYRKAEEDLLKSEERFQKMLSIIPDMISIHDTDFNILYGNWKGFGDITEEKRKFNTKCYKTYRNNDDICEDCQVKNVIKSKAPFQKQVKLPENIWIELRVIPILDKDNNVEMILEWVKDISEQKKAEKKLNNNEKLFRGLYNNIPSGSAIYEVKNDGSKGKDYIIKMFNKKSLEIERKTLEEVVGKSLYDLRPNIDDYGLIQEMQKVWKTGKFSYLPSKIYIDENYTNYYENYIFKAPTGEVVTIYNDVTEQKNKEILINEMNIELEASNEELESTNKELENNYNILEQINKELEIANEVKSAFLARVSHELRTPMNGILGGVYLVNQSEGIEQKNEYLKLIEQSAKRLMPIIDDILTISNKESKPLTFKDTLEIRETLNQEIFKFKPIADKKNISFILNNKIREKVFVKTDKKSLFQILNRIINNAIKYTEEGKVEIISEIEELQNNKLNLRLKISDTGTGIKKEFYNKIFEPFEQEELYLTRKHQGLGLGLSIVKYLIEKIGGTITFESEEGKGTTFYVEVILDIVNKTEEIINNKIELSTNKIKILAAEDDEIGIKLLKELFKKQPYDLDIVNNGKKAVDLYKTKDYDLILMDIQMPILDGIEATKMIRDIEKQTNKNTPIIAVTGHANHEDEKRCLNAGMDDFITKPYEFEDLINKINKNSREPKIY